MLNSTRDIEVRLPQCKTYVAGFIARGIAQVHTTVNLCGCTSNRLCIYHISLKSHRGEILFEGPVRCSSNSRVDRYRGQCLQRLTNTQL